MRVSFRQMFSGLLLAALASAPLGCGDDDGSEVDAGGEADAGAEVAPQTDVTTEQANAPADQAAQPR
jgi:hypothetical protein